MRDTSSMNGAERVPGTYASSVGGNGIRASLVRWAPVAVITVVAIVTVVATVTGTAAVIVTVT